MFPSSKNFSACFTLKSKSWSSVLGVKHAEKFLEDGNKVKAHVQFKGRAIMFKERGELLLLKFADALKDVSALEGLPKLEGKRMQVMLAPRIIKKKSGNELGKLHKEKPADAVTEEQTVQVSVEETSASE